METARASLASMSETNKTLEGQIEEANLALEASQEKVASLEEEKKTVSQAAAEKLHELGVPAAELPKAATPGEDDAALYERYRTLKGAERTAFLRKNREALTRFAKQASEVI